MHSFSEVNLFVHDGFYCAHTGAGIHNFRVIKSLRAIFPNAKITIFPIYTSEKSADYQSSWHEGVLSIVKRDSLYVKPVDNGSQGMERYGWVSQWITGSINAADQFKNQHQAGVTSLCITMDTSFVQMISLLNNLPSITHLHIPHGTGRVHSPGALDRLELESVNFAQLESSDNTYIGYIGDFMESHLRSAYSISTRKLIPAYNGCLLDENYALTPSVTNRFNEKWNMDDNKLTIAAFGRAAPYKGFHTLVKAMRNFDSEKYRLLINATTDNQESLQYKALLVESAKKYNVDLLIHSEFDADFPAYVRRHPKTLCIVVPSIHEPFGLIPGEVMTDSLNTSLIVANNIEGLASQIDNEKTGFLFDNKVKGESLEDRLRVVVGLNGVGRKQMLRQMSRYGNDHYNLIANLRSTMTCLNEKVNLD